MRTLAVAVVVGLLAYFASTKYEPPIVDGYNHGVNRNPLGLTAKEQRDYHLNQSCAPIPGCWTQGCLVIK